MSKELSVQDSGTWTVENVNTKHSKYDIEGLENENILVWFFLNLRTF